VHDDDAVIRLILAAILYLVANAVGLIVAAAILDDMSLDTSGFILAVLIFTGVEVLITPLIQKMALRRSSALVGGSALIASLIGLIVTDVISDGMEIRGAVTWLLATVIVWAAALIAGLILPAVFLKKRVAAAR
jgi:putative membrane protein